MYISLKPLFFLKTEKYLPTLLHFQTVSAYCNLKQVIKAATEVAVTDLICTPPPLT